MCHMDSDKAPKWSDLGKHFADPDLARQMLERMRWPNGPACPHCGGADPYTITGKATSKKPARKGLYKCRACRKQFTVTVGTVFEDSHIPMNVWLQAIYLLCSSKKGISAHQLHRMLGITYKSAWFMAHRLRYAMTQTPLVEKLNGIVEADECYIGGKVKPKIHTNTVEGFFGLLKRGINGIYHHVGKGHINRYVDEFVFRYDNRKISDGDRAFLAVAGAEGKRLTYKQPA